MTDHRQPTPQSARPGRLFLCAFVVITTIFGKPIVNGDGVQYYAYARSPVIDRDLDFRNEYAEGLPRYKASVPLPETTARGLQNAYAPVGAAVIWTPFMAAAHAAVLLLRGAGVQLVANGYADAYMFTITLASWLTMLAGLLLCYQVACRWFAPRAALFAVVGGWLASPLFANAYELPTFVHAVDFGLVSVLVYLVVTADERANYSEWFFIGLAFGWVVEVRQQNVTFVLLPAIYWVRLWIANRTGSRSGAERCLAAALAGAAIGYLPQMAMNVGLHGAPIVWPSKYVRLDWPPHFWRDLFSWDQGLFSWTPAMLPAVVGLASAVRDPRRRLLASIGCAVFMLNLLLIGSLSYGPVLIGQRYLINCVPFLILGLGVVFETLGVDRSQLKGALAGSVLALFVVWNINLETMAVYGGINPRAPITAPELARHQLVTAPRYWIKHVQGESISRPSFSVVNGFRIGLQGHVMVLIKAAVALGGIVAGTWAAAHLACILAGYRAGRRRGPSIRALGSIAVLLPVLVAGYWLWLGRPFEIFQ